MSKSRPLTTSEISLAKLIFSSSINYQKVKVHEGKYTPLQPSNSGMTPNGEIFVHGSYRKDYSLTSDELKAFFIHEMVHVYQYQLKILDPIGSAISSSIKNGFNYIKAYDYKLEPNKDLLDYDIEQQAQIIEDYYRIYFLNLKPFNGHMKNNLINVKNEKLFEQTLQKFLKNPNYAKHEIICIKKRFGKDKKITCSRVLAQ